MAWHGTSVASRNRRGCGCRSWFGTGLEPERSYVHLNSACEQLVYCVSARETYFGGSRFLRFSRAPFFNPTTEGKLYRLPSNQVLQRRY